MRLKLTLSLASTSAGRILPQSHLYELSLWLYASFVHHGDTFRAWLDANGRQEEIADFRLFCFSGLVIPAFDVNRDRLVMESKDVYFYLSFLPEKGTAEMVRQLFENQLAIIGDFLTQAEFVVTAIEQLDAPILDSGLFKTLSPINLSILRRDGTKMCISPETENFGELLFQNLKNKYEDFYGAPFDGSLAYSFHLLQPSYSRSFVIKAGTKAETKMRGFETSFRIEADERLLSIGYEAGFGENGSIGFGMVDAIED